MTVVTMEKPKGGGIGPAAKACKGKKGKAFQSCVKQKMKARSKKK